MLIKNLFFYNFFSTKISNCFQEVTHKTEKINNLEREKAALIRELYQVRRKSDQTVCKAPTGSDNVPVAPSAYI